MTKKKKTRNWLVITLVVFVLFESIIFAMLYHKMLSWQEKAQQQIDALLHSDCRSIDTRLDFLENRLK